VDRVSPDVRSRTMSAIRSIDTSPEITVRRILHGLGFRYRLHQRTLPGSPDVVLPRHRKIVFVHGCYWHVHSCAAGGLPKSRLEYWGPKLARNVARDEENLRALEALGWDVLVVWECETKHHKHLKGRLLQFMAA
jgi:DNA mismatch endonuclease (patch repair protein)